MIDDYPEYEEKLSYDDLVPIIESFNAYIRQNVGDAEFLAGTRLECEKSGYVNIFFRGFLVLSYIAGSVNINLSLINLMKFIQNKTVKQFFKQFLLHVKTPRIFYPNTNYVFLELDDPQYEPDFDEPYCAGEIFFIEPDAKMYPYGDKIGINPYIQDSCQDGYRRSI